MNSGAPRRETLLGHVPQEELVMKVSRLASWLPVVAVVAVVALAPRPAHADVSVRVADIAAKGTIPPVVPVEAGLGLGFAAGLLALGMQRRSRP